MARPRGPLPGGLAGLTLAFLALVSGGCRSTQREVYESARWQDAQRASLSGDWERAASLWQRCADNDPSFSPQPYFESGRAYCALERHDVARVLLSRGLERFPEDAALFEQRGVCLAELGYRRAAEEDLRTATRIDPQRSSAWLHLGRVQLALELPTRAIESLDRYRKLVGDGLTAEQARELGRAAWAAGELELAVECYEDALAREPERVDLIVEAATLFGEEELSGKSGLGRSMELIERALGRNPQYEEAHFVKGLFLERAGDLEDAVECYRRAAELDNFHLGALTNLAILYDLLGEPTRMREMVERALQLERDEVRRETLRGMLADPMARVSPR